VHVALAAQKLLAEEGKRVRVVSMPSWERFAAQEPAYRDKVLPKAVRARLAIEAGVTIGWQRWVGDDGDILGLDHFGASAPGDLVFKRFNFTPEHAAERVRALLDRTAAR
jgi:transketolase